MGVFGLVFLGDIELETMVFTLVQSFLVDFRFMNPLLRGCFDVSLFQFSLGSFVENNFLAYSEDLLIVFFLVAKAKGRNDHCDVIL